METKIHPCEEGGLAGWDWTKRVLDNFEYCSILLTVGL
jgi:hypothetical protein